MSHPVAPPNPRYRLSVVVPVFDEARATLRRQLESLGAQTEIAPGEVEALYVINNGPPDGSVRYREAFAANQRLLGNSALWQSPLRNGLVVRVVDASSPGSEIPDCNIGRARDIGLRHAAGELVISSDADAYFEDSRFLARARELFRRHPSAIAAAGGRIMELDPADFAAYPRAVVEQFVIVARCRMLLLVLRGLKPQNAFRGANLMYRRREALAAGGFPHVAFEEDGQFAARLISYAARHRQEVLPTQYDLRVVVRGRLSERTGNQFEPDIKQLAAGTPITARHPQTNAEIELNAATYQQLRREVEALPPPAATAGLRFVDELGAVRWTGPAA